MKAVVIYSGGMDSYTLIHHMRSKGYDVHALSFNYGQRHKKELIKAGEVCAKFDIPHMIVDVTSINDLLQGSALTSDIDVPEGHYADDNMKQTVVPNRNMIMLSLAVGYAVSIGADTVAFGAHAGDHAIYPDCRESFVEAMNQVTKIANYQPVQILAPFLGMDKYGILQIGQALGLDYGDTWTCYKGREKACGKCGSCVERLEAFAKLGTTDPVEYE